MIQDGVMRFSSEVADSKEIEEATAFRGTDCLLSLACYCGSIWRSESPYRLPGGRRHTQLVSGGFDGPELRNDTHQANDVDKKNGQKGLNHATNGFARVQPIRDRRRTMVHHWTVGGVMFHGCQLPPGRAASPAVCPTPLEAHDDQVPGPRVPEPVTERQKIAQRCRIDDGNWHIFCDFERCDLYEEERGGQREAGQVGVVAAADGTEQEDGCEQAEGGAERQQTGARVVDDRVHHSSSIRLVPHVSRATPRPADDQATVLRVDHVVLEREKAHGLGGSETHSLADGGS